MGLFTFLFPAHVSRASHSTHTLTDISTYPQLDVSFQLTTTTSPRPLPAITSASTPQIPLEIVLDILEASYYDDDLNPDAALLSSCSLVSKAWSPHAQKLLFKHVTLRTKSAYSAFAYALKQDSPRAAMLAASVLRMRVVLDANDPDAVPHESFAHAVTLCPNLYDLNLSLYASPHRATPPADLGPTSTRVLSTAPSFSESTIELLASSPKISSLHFTNWTNDQQAILPLLTTWPSLHSLALTGTPPKLPPSPAESFPGSLAELRINCQSYPSLDFFDWLLRSSALASLELERDPTADLLNHFADAHGTSLISLALPSLGSDLVASVHRLPSLRELRTENPWTSPAVYRRLPSSLQHIALGLDLDTPLTPLLDLVKSSSSSHEAFDVVTVLLWNNGDKHPQLAALKMACAFTGVELRVMRDVKKVRTMGRGDPISATVFPREKRVDNYMLMAPLVG